MYAQISDRPADSMILTGAVVTYVALFASVHALLGAAAPAAGFRLTAGVVGLLSAVIGGAFTLAGTWMVVKHRNDPNITTLLAKIADLEEQLAERPAPRRHRGKEAD